MGEAETHTEASAAPETPGPETPAPEVPAPETPTAETAAAETSAPEASAAETPVAETPAAETPARPAAPPAPEVPDEVARQRNLRVSDDEREHVVDLLQKAIGRGMLDLDEFTERTDIALAARTRGELNAVLIDLPGLVHRDAVTPSPVAVSPGPTGVNPYAPPADPGGRVELKAHGSSLVRKGRWYVPAELLVRNKYGNTTLDFSEADVASPVVHVVLDTKWSSVTMTIPPHAAVDLNGLSEVKWSNINDTTRSNGRDGAPRFVVTGRVHGGSLSVRNPRKGLMKDVFGH